MNSELKTQNSKLQLCQRCHEPKGEEDLVPFWQYKICYDCNRELAGLLRETVRIFVGLPAPVPPGQMRLTL